jgi:ribosomal protein S18 acetylase RimI-like enzyme
MTMLAPMSEEVFAAFVAMSVKGYADDNVAAGRWTADEALALSRAEFSRLLPQGLATPDHHLYEIRDEAGGTPVGFLWFATVTRGNTKVAYVYQLEVHREFRRRGHARAAFLAMESLAAAMGLSSIGLHVFGHATGAQALYSSLGYQVTGINMQKRLPVTGTRRDA